MDDQLAPSEDSEASALLEKTFEKEGIVYYNGKKIESVKNKSDGIYTETTAGTFVSDQILVATGRKPAFDSLNLEAAGIDYDKKHIKVDAFNRTNIKNIYALGDINGKWLFTHAAMHQAMLSLMQALGNNETKHLEQDNYVVPRAIFTDPEIAQVGLTENEVKKNELNYFLIKEYYKNYARAVTDGSPEGFVKIITDDSGKIYGATIVGERASELITEWTLAMQHNLKMMDILMTQHTFPTFSVLNKNAAEKWMMKLASEGKLGEIF